MCDTEKSGNLDYSTYYAMWETAFSQSEVRLSSVNKFKDYGGLTWLLCPISSNCHKYVTADETVYVKFVCSCVVWRFNC